ncbi:MAG: Stp1/IreP family PP2C-type Ser/Thr phosphatase [Thermodesulfobacteriota bacterium]
MYFQTYSLSDIGKVRRRNEDAFLEKFLKTEKGSKAVAMIVADGMGGHKAGDVASSKVISVFEQNLDIENLHSIEQQLKNSIIEANNSIINMSISKDEFKGMGTTCTAMILADEKCFIAHVGDSRAYLVRKKTIKQLTKDHTVAEHMVSFGMMTEEEAKLSPKRNVLMRAIGINEELEIDILSPIDIEYNDIFILCSDGLIEYLEEEEIKNIASEHDPETACNKMIETANSRGGHDNITVQITKVLKSKKGGLLSNLKKMIANTTF